MGEIFVFILLLVVLAPIGRAIGKAIQSKYGEASNEEIKKLHAEITSLKENIEQMNLRIKHVEEDYEFVERLLKETTSKLLGG